MEAVKSQKISLEKMIVSILIGGMCVAANLPKCNAFSPIFHGHRLSRSSTQLDEKYLVCFDGTGNNPMNGVEPRTTSSITNVLKLHFLAGGSLDKTLPSNVPGQKSFYYTGVGTRSSSQLLNTARYAFALAGPELAIDEAEKDLKSNFNPGADELYVFGFSRGAATARLFTQRLNDHGFTTDSGVKVQKPPIAFLGVWDTVADIGVVNLNPFELPSCRFLDEKGVIAPIIQNALHLISLDDNRVLFFPTPMGVETDKPVTEIRFPGTHSDVGGGFYEQGLSDGSLKYMMRYASQDIGAGKNLNFLTGSQVPDTALAFIDSSGNPQAITNRTQLEILPNVASKLHGFEKDPLNKGLTAKTLFTNRPVYNVKNGHAIPDSVVLVHESVIQRMKAVPGYDPADLKNVKFRIVKDDGTVLPQIHTGTATLQTMSLTAILG